MTLTALRTELKEIQPLRALFLQETNFQIRYNACHERGWTDSYLLTFDGVAVGYGAVKGRKVSARDTVFEFFIVPPFRSRAPELFRALLTASAAANVECQSNDRLLSAMLYESAKSVRSDVVLFADHAVTAYTVAGAMVRPRRTGDAVFEHRFEPIGDYVVESNGEVIATGGFLTHYNPPFADLFMEVREDCRKRGIGSFLLQEVKKYCYLAGRVPAARCDISNAASRATLVKAGMTICGYMLLGRVANPQPLRAAPRRI